MATVELHSERLPATATATATVAAARERGLRLAEPEWFETAAGRGVQATVDGRRLWAGGSRGIAERAGSVPDAVTTLEHTGVMVIALGEGSRALAWFGLADEPRSEAADAVTALHAAGITRIVMLTGDLEPVARAVAESTGIGVAMGAAGSDVALQSADVTLMGDRLDRLALAVAVAADIGMSLLVTLNALRLLLDIDRDGIGG